MKADSIDTTVSITTGHDRADRNLGSDSNASNPNTGTITVDTGVQGCTFVIKKANFNGLQSADCAGKRLVAPDSAGLVLMGPAFDSNPIANCTLNSTCTTEYSSSNDAQSRCVLEQNGPVRATVRCSGGLKDGAGNKYMGFQVRMHFYAGKQRIRIVATLKNADDGKQGTFPISYKGYQSLEFRLATTLARSNAWAIADGASTPKQGTFTHSGQSAYVYQAFATSYLDSGYCPGVPDAASDIARSSQGGTCIYAESGFVIVDQSGSVVESQSAGVGAGGWADVKDASGGWGVEIGSEYLAQNFPRSLQIMNSGQEVRIGISPDQGLWKGQCDSRVESCRKTY